MFHLYQQKNETSDITVQTFFLRFMVRSVSLFANLFCRPFQDHTVKTLKKEVDF